MHQEITSRWGKGMIFRQKGNPFTFSRSVSPKGTEQNLEGPGKVGGGRFIYFDTYWNLRLENYLYCIKLTVLFRHASISCVCVSRTLV